MMRIGDRVSQLNETMRNISNCTGEEMHCVPKSEQLQGGSIPDDLIELRRKEVGVEK